MPISDYLPNVFGYAPVGVEGLLGADQTQELNKQANVSGLLGAAFALAAGMSRSGEPRSAAQNILGALGAGVGAAQGQYKGALDNLLTRQKLAATQYEAMKNMREAQRGELLFGQQDALLNDPLVQRFPELRALVLADPKSAAEQIRVIREREAFMNRGRPAIASSAQPTAAVAQQGGEPSLPAVEVSAPNLSAVDQQIAEAESAAQYFASIMRPDEAKKYQEVATNLRANRGQLELSNAVSNSLNGVYPTLQGRVKALISDAPSMTREQIVTERNAILAEDAKIKGELDPTLFQNEVAKRKAGATTINMPSESERTAGFLTTRLQGALAQLQAVVGIAPEAASPNVGAEAVKFVTGSDYLKNLINPETRQQVEAAQLEVLDAALTLGTGAAYTREQLENYRKSYFPQLNDKPGTIADKQKRLESLLNAARLKSGRAVPAAPTLPPGVTVNERRGN